MVLNEAVQVLREAEELKQKILKFKNGVSMLQERNIWVKQQQLQKLYQKLLVLDLDYALDKKVEQDLWNVGFKQQIEALQAISKDRKNPRRSDGQQMLSWVLQAATGFYLCLLHQISTAFKLDLPFRRRASLLGLVETWGAGGGDAHAPPPAAALYICQHCLVHLGDLARYRQQLHVAHSFYRHALLVSAHSGQPYNQLALVSWRRGRKLGALYWHVRSLLVRAPFPPAPANLARTLAAAARSTQNTEDLPVLPGVSDGASVAKPVQTSPARLTAHSYVSELIRAYHLIHTIEELETARKLVSKLNSSLTALVTTDSFDPMTLVKMACITIWLVGWATEELQVSSEMLSVAEREAADLAVALAAGMLVALLLSAHTHTHSALPALKVLLEWVAACPRLLAEPSVLARPQLWPALAHTLNALAVSTTHFDGSQYTSAPLPEDEELHGFLPLEPALAGLRLCKFASWDTYADRVPLCDEPATSQDHASERVEGGGCAVGVEGELRAWRLVQLGRRLAAAHPQHLLFSEIEDVPTFTAPQSTPELARALEELAVGGEVETSEGEGGGDESEEESDDELRLPPPPVIISEADFREKVREKRVGILKPQGSLERAREERALIAATQDGGQESTSASESVSGEEAARSAAAKIRTNVAMQAILRVQEESGKQVKFVTPSATPDSIVDPAELSPNKEVEKTKILQPKAIKSLANIPIGKKTGGILSLKDKSAGYPHLVNAEPEQPKKLEDGEKNKKVDGPPAKLGQGSSQNSQHTPQNNYHQGNYSNKIRMDQQHQHTPGQPSWPPTGAKTLLNHPAPYAETPRMSYSHQKTYNQQNSPVNFNNLYNQQNQMNPHNQGIRLPVVNPKEIDVRSAALQKQYSRPEFFQDAPKFGTQSWQVSGDKKAFLNDLPPRFANQFRNWSNMPADQQYGKMEQEKLQDDMYKTNMMYGNNQPQNLHPSWNNPPLSAENPTQPSYGWWNTNTSNNNFNPNFAPPSMNPQNNFYPQPPANPYQIPNYTPMSMQQQGFQTKPLENPLNTIGSNFMQPGLTQPQAQSLQNLIKSPNYNAAINSFGNYSQSVNYDSAMYPQFTSNKLGYQPPTAKMSDKPLSGYGQQKDSIVDLGHGLGLGSSGMNDLHPRSHLTMDLMAGVLTNDNLNLMKSLDQLGMSESGAEGANTYSLFSGGEEAAGAGWGGAGTHLNTHVQHPQSLWSGPGPSPLERLLEQQKQLNKSSGEQQ